MTILKFNEVFIHPDLTSFLARLIILKKSEVVIDSVLTPFFVRLIILKKSEVILYLDPTLLLTQDVYLEEHWGRPWL
jgi:hypothetical protein